MPHKIKKILIVRNDKLGDFMLSFSTFATLRQHLPAASLHALVPEYTRPLAEVCEYIDVVQRDPGQAAGWRGIGSLIRTLRNEKYDAVITLYSTTRIGLAVWLAGIPLRIAPATKIAQIFYNHRLIQHRSRSEKPEHIYNRELAEYLLQKINVKFSTNIQGAFLKFADSEIQQLQADFISRYSIPVGHQRVFVHPGNGGSATNLSLQNYARLINQLHSTKSFTVVISCGPTEVDAAQKLSDMLDVKHIVYVSDQGLLLFAKHLQLADVFISGSTGPLHVAGVLDRPSVGFYPRRQSATSLRWQTLNREGRRLAFSPPQNCAAEDMAGIDITAAAKQISERFL